MKQMEAETVAYGPWVPKAEDDALLPEPATTKKKASGGFDWIVTILFLLFLIFSALYNIDNKKACALTPAPLSIALIQFGIGWLWFVPLWIFRIRPRPRFHSTSLIFTRMVPQGVCHTVVHTGGVISMAAGAVSFTHIVKAFEPVFTSVLSIFVLNHFFSIVTYTTLVPIMGGVVLACFAEPNFNWLAFGSAMASNVGSSARGVLTKQTMNDPNAVGINLTPPNIYAILTIVGTLILIPVVLIVERFAIFTKFNIGTLANGNKAPAWQAVLYIITSAVYYYAYNEISFHALARVDQLTHAVVNTLKRIFIIITAVIVFNHPIGIRGYIGTATAILGAFLFSISKQKFG